VCVTHTGGKTVGRHMGGKPADFVFCRKLWRHSASSSRIPGAEARCNRALRSARGCAAFPAITAVGKGLDVYVAVDASGTFSETKRQVGLLRMLQAGVILSDYATLMAEILKDNARPEAGPVYAAIDMPWAKLVGQIAQAS
jgi:hypothetical protein